MPAVGAFSMTLPVTATSASTPMPIPALSPGSVPAGRLGAGSDVAAAVVYLASNEAAYVTGQTLHVNGGMAMI